ncbi:MAG: DUF4340 domain-containing protein [Puniceicoccales bacterium]|jgi:hypothetical protein|nr:DUF4340 domain-containing protein [Puniceicoccales bacterium]
MRFKITALLLLANAITLGLIWHFENNRNHGATAATTPLFTPDIHAITFDGPGVSQPYTLEKHAHGWRLAQPYAWEAELSHVNRILEHLRFLQLDESFTIAEAKATGSTLANYGLDTPQARLSVRGTAPTPINIQIGNPGTGKIYLLTDTGRIIHHNTEKLFASLNHTPEHLRARTIFTVGSHEVRNIVIHSTAPGAPEQHTRIKRDQRPPHPGQTDIERIWRIETPISADASRHLVEARLEQLTRLAYQRFLPPAPETTTPEQLQQTGLATPVLRITLEGNNRFQTLHIGNPDPATIDTRNPARFAKLEGNRAIFTLRESDINVWNNAASTLREREFFQFPPALLTEITLRHNNQTLVFHRRDDTTEWGEWTIPKLPGTTATVTLATDPQIMRQLITTLNHLHAENFVTDTPTPAQLQQTGLAIPAYQIELAFKDAARRTLHIATPPNAPPEAPLYAQIAGEPTLYTLATGFLRHLPLDPKHYRNRLVEQLPPDTLTSVKITDLATRKALLTLSRAPNETWDKVLLAHPQHERIPMRTLLAQLTTLRARQYLADTFRLDYTEKHLDATTPEPWRYLLETTTSTPATTANDTRKLYLTKRLGGTTQTAGSPVQNCIFHIEQPLMDALFPFTFERDPSREIIPIPQAPDLPQAPPATPQTQSEKH